ncbi:MAG: Gfo/Idh/MocA family oxidoreductase [Acidobacteriaceae bacterium]
MSQVRIGIIGAGWWVVTNDMPVFQSRSDVKIVSVCRRGRAELKKIQEQFGIEFGDDDYRNLLDRKNLDAVVVSSPHHLHLEHASAALEAGYHVLCEKPMTLRAVHARQLEYLTEKMQRHFLIPYGWNYTEMAAKAREWVASGRIGKVQHVLCHMASATRELFSGKEFWLSKDDLLKPDLKAWSDPVRGGGFAHGQLTHALALLLYITELKVSEVFAFMGRSETGADLSDSISCRFENGATGTIGGAGMMPPKGPTHQVDIQIFGEDGVLLLDISKPNIELRRNDGTTMIESVNPELGKYSCVEPLHTFVNLIQGKPGVENRSPASLGVRVVEILDGAFCSVASGRAVKVDSLN